MLEQALLRERFEELLTRQQQAVDGYSDLARNLSGPAVREKIEQLLREKHRHVRLTERLLELLLF